MKSNNEYKLKPNEIIVSKTCPKGRIIYANRPFMELSGYGEPELLGLPHNIIRHPDMPRGVYYLLWKTLQSGREFFGYVKNSTADGGYYWVLANITPDLRSDSSLAGYFSIRRSPNYAAIARIETWYQTMRKIESQTSTSKAPEASSDWLLAEVAKSGMDYNQFIMHLDEREV